MKTLYMTVGLPASGKTTWAKEKLAENPGAYKRVNKDDLRAMLDAGRWSGDNEKFVLSVRDHVVSSALGAGKHVIVDDTNLAPKHQERLRELASRSGAQLEVVDFRHVGVEECIERDSKRANYVGERVIRDMHEKFIAVKPEPIASDPSLPWCVIVDIDGTVAIMNGRGPFEWGRVCEDVPNRPVCELVQSLLVRSMERVVFVSGRDGSCREQTVNWLYKNHLFGHHGIPPIIHMRPDGDMRDDRIIKEEIYRREIEGKYNVRFVLDDRDKVVRMWRSLGLTCLQVAEGNF